MRRSRDGREIEVVVVAAGGIEGSAAMGAGGVAGEIGGDGENGTAGAAEDGRFVPLGLRPGLDGMIGEGDVAILAGVKEAATFHFDGNDIERRAVVKATSLGVEIKAVDHGGEWHGARIARKWPATRRKARGEKRERRREVLARRAIA